jgi:hypothetical protein
MKNKIQPAQYKPYDLLSVTGNISIDSGLDYFNIDLSEELVGDLNIDGTLKISGLNVLSPHSSNTISDTSFSNGCRILAGENNIISGNNNCIVFGYDNNVAGGYNSVLFGQNASLGAQNSVAIGNNISITHNGAAVFGDSTNNSKISYAPDSLTIEYTGGASIRTTTHFSEKVFSDSDFTITGAISGLSLTIEDNARFLSSINVQDSAVITGSLSVTGSTIIKGVTNLESTFITGFRAATSFDIRNYSGYVASTFTTKSEFSTFTGHTTSGINLLSGQITGKLGISTFNTYTGSTLSSQAVVLTGDQNISGIKSFKGLPEFCHGFMFPTINNCSRYIPLTPTSTGQAGHVAFSGRFLYIATGTNQWGRVQLSAW